MSTRRSASEARPRTSDNSASVRSVNAFTLPSRRFVCDVDRPHVGVRKLVHDDRAVAGWHPEQHLVCPSARQATAAVTSGTPAGSGSRQMTWISRPVRAKARAR